MCRDNDPRYAECVPGAGLIKPALLSLVRVPFAGALLLRYTLASNRQTDIRLSGS